ncbi:MULTISPECIES: ABC transporter substrate-binding protein [Salipiger]|uniref:Branched-chain amino acid ABC transporter, periplasmic substrate-binding protein n=1 Tax=Salipiger bermudensis (strain DSM 26914 / JCM 13377 / KCTC 12554 / HTCC2601) TaxID=314265 RepID=Q0FN46_SALBH|nr:ABC transporter substrate-binding protein [Salipiger bermudensis]EAU45596.1 branched-chain amino acid ABC transporter, periplasmic substrate-binding protein [Salipiger bermudensis HTCC2601]MBN9675800.1 ABC transporter substrate-binding protein [Salipiger bermudensis]MBR9891768.1 ABC transporter substrate-binding protein [bacterium]MCA1285618.1 ABC transporter substrate-binding protein [Salipiger bermudensis]
MNFLRRTVLATAAAMALVPAAGFAQETIKVGEINHYKRMAAFAEPYKLGIELALSEINEAGGVLGQELEFIFRDDQGDPAEAVKIAEELMTRDGAVMLTGTILSHVGLALSSFAAEKGYLYLASEPLADSLVWKSGNPYTFRLRASTWVQAAMLAEEAAKTDAIKYATIAPNYAYGQDAVEAFKANLKRLKPEVEFVAEQWPALFKIDAGAEVQAIERAKPDAIYNVTFGTDLAKFVRDGGDRGLFDGRNVYGLLTGEPEYLEPLGDEAPEGWFVTGFPWYGFEDGTPGKTFVDAYTEATGETPKIGSLVGYMTAQSIAAGIEAAGATDTESLVAAFEGLTVENTPIGELTYREIDNQSTLGAWVGTTALEDGKGVMVDWEYKDPAPYMPSDEDITAMRPAE